MSTAIGEMTIEVPRQIKERFDPEEGASHSLVETRGQFQLWESTIDRSSRGLPQYVRYHIMRGGDDEWLLLPKRNALMAWASLTFTRRNLALAKAT